MWQYTETILTCLPAKFEQPYTTRQGISMSSTLIHSYRGDCSFPFGLFVNIPAEVEAVQERVVVSTSEVVVVVVAGAA